MTPDKMSDLLVSWVFCGDRFRGDQPSATRRVVCLEPDGPRRTWVLYEGGRQVGLVRVRNLAAESWERSAREAEESGAWDVVAFQDMRIAECCMDPTDEKWASPWTVEASDRTLAMLGLGES